MTSDSTQTRWTAALVASLLVALSPAVAKADAGTPLMWATIFQLLVGNALIGVLEGVLVARVFSGRLRRCLLIMILANYVSAWLGLLVLRPPAFLLGPEPLYRVHEVVIELFVASFVVSVVIEWPFVAWALRGRPKLLTTSFRASLLAQTASYALLVPWFWYVSSTSLVAQLRIDPSVVAEAGHEVDVFYLGPDGHHVYRANLDGTAVVPVAEVPSRSEPLVLTPRRSTDELGWDLWVGTRDRSPSDAIAIRAFATCGASLPPVTDDQPDPWSWERPFLANPGENWIAELPTPYAWPGHGFIIEDRRTGVKFGPNIEVPGLSWRTGDATWLPNDRVVFEIQSHPPEIALMDVASRRVGVVGIGRSPVATLHGTIPCQPEQESRVPRRQ